jgi:hypothetical protein
MTGLVDMLPSVRNTDKALMAGNETLHDENVVKLAKHVFAQFMYNNDIETIRRVAQLIRHYVPNSQERDEALKILEEEENEDDDL